MRVDATRHNSTINSIIRNPNQIIFLDANILIPPGRFNNIFNKDKYISFFLEPLFTTFQV